MSVNGFILVSARAQTCQVLLPVLVAMRTFSRSVGFLVVLALSTLVVCAEPEGATTTGTSTATIEEKSARTEETKNAVSSASPDTQQKVHAKTPVVTTASKTEKAGTQHSTSASAPRQEMVSGCSAACPL